MWLNYSKYIGFRKGPLSPIGHSKVALRAPKSELLGSFWAPFWIFEVTFGTFGLCLEVWRVPGLPGSGFQTVWGTVFQPPEVQNSKNPNKAQGGQDLKRTFSVWFRAPKERFYWIPGCHLSPVTFDH